MMQRNDSNVLKIAEMRHLIFNQMPVTTLAKLNMATKELKKDTQNTKLDVIHVISGILVIEDRKAQKFAIQHLNEYLFISEMLKKNHKSISIPEKVLRSLLKNKFDKLSLSVAEAVRMIIGLEAASVRNFIRLTRLNENLAENITNPKTDWDRLAQTLLIDNVNKINCRKTSAALQRIISDKEEKDEIFKIRLTSSINTTLFACEKNIGKLRSINMNVYKNLSSIDLSKSDLSNLNFCGANFTNAKLAYAKLTRAKLAFARITLADFTRALLMEADLTDADLAGAGFEDAYLMEADLTHANLAYAYLMGANLTGANLTRANLTCTVLSRKHDINAVIREFMHPTVNHNYTCANLARADLRGARLVDTALTNVILIRAITDAGCIFPDAITDFRKLATAVISDTHTYTTFISVCIGVLWEHAQDLTASKLIDLMQTKNLKDFYRLICDYKKSIPKRSHSFFASAAAKKRTPLELLIKDIKAGAEIIMKNKIKSHPSNKAR